MPELPTDCHRYVAPRQFRGTEADDEYARFRERLGLKWRRDILDNIVTEDSP